MAKDAITFIEVVGLDQVDLSRFSMGGMTAREIVVMKPKLVRKCSFGNRPPLVAKTSARWPECRTWTCSEAC
jgi:pimeloyl-ACP methyl ester carboxylesterase